MSKLVLLGGGTRITLAVGLVNLIRLLPFRLHVLVSLSGFVEVFVAGEFQVLHALQTLLRALVGVCALHAHAVAPRAMPYAHAGRQHEDLLAYHTLVFLILFVNQGMSLDVFSASEQLPADVAAEGAHARVDDQVSL